MMLYAKVKHQNILSWAQTPSPVQPPGTISHGMHPITVATVAREPKSSMGGSKPSRSAWADVARFSDLGLRVVATAVAGGAGGFWLDRELGLLERFPVLTLIGLALGLGGGMVVVARAVAPNQDREEQS